MYRIFVSSSQDEFAEERRAIKRHVPEDALLRRWFDVFLFEDHPAQGAPAPDIYLGEVEKRDVYVGILGYRESPATDMEFHRAKELGKEFLIYVKGGKETDSKRDKGVMRLMQEAQNHCKYLRFQNTQELIKGISESLVVSLQNKGVISSIPFDERVCEGSTIDDIDEKKVKWFLRRARAERNFPPDENTPAGDVLLHLHLLKGGKPTNSAILAFGKNPQKFHAQAFINCVQFSGTEIRQPFITQHHYEGDLFDQIDGAFGFVMGALKLPAIPESGSASLKREYEIPEFAVREAIVNAAAHRDYHSTASVQVRVFVDRIEIWNPGKLMPGVAIETLKGRHESIPRNPRICKPLYYTAYVQEIGSGTMEMARLCEEKGLPAPEFKEEGIGFITIIWRDKFTEDYLKKMGLNERQIKAIAYIKEKKRITNKEYQNINSASRQTASRELADITQKGILQQKGVTGRGAFYILV